MKRWAAASVRTGSEIPLAEHLREAGHEIYCPQYIPGRRPAGKRWPIFDGEPKAGLPGYLFIDHTTIMDPEGIYRDRRFHYFIRDVVGAFVLLEDEIVDEMREREALGAFQERSEGGPVFCEGETVRVPRGVYEGWRGHVKEVRGAVVRLDGLDFTRPVWFTALTLLRESV